MSTVSSTTPATTTTTSPTTSSTTTSTSSSKSKASNSTDYLSFDTASLVEAKLASRYTRIDSLNTQVNANTTKKAAYQDMQSKLSTLMSALSELRADPSSVGRSSDVFRDRTAYLTTAGSASASNYMSATVSEGTEMGKHTIEIQDVAKANILGSAAKTSRTDPLGLSGTISLGLAGGTAADVTVTAGMSLGDIADKINAEQATTGVKASVIKVADDSFQLVLTATQTGKAIVPKDIVGGVLDNLGIVDGDGAIETSAVLQAAKNAKLIVDGVTLTRSTNDISDILDGVTLHLYAAPSTATPLTLEVANDLTAIKQSITDFVDAYNAFRDFVVANQSTNSDGTASGAATLFGDGTLRDIAQSAQTILSSSVDTKSLGAIGISFDASNKLQIDSTKLDNALQDRLDDIKTLFAYTMTSSSGDLGMVRHPNRSLDFTLNVTVDASGALIGASVGGDSSKFTIRDKTIIGKPGTAYEGFTLYYTGSTSKSIALSFKQGIADQLYDAVEKVTAEDGRISAQIASLETQNVDLTDRISVLEETTASYRNALTILYANMASKMYTAQTTLDLLKALLDASNK